MGQTQIMFTSCFSSEAELGWFGLESDQIGIPTVQELYPPWLELMNMEVENPLVVEEHGLPRAILYFHVSSKHTVILAIDDTRSPTGPRSPTTTL